MDKEKIKAMQKIRPQDPNKIYIRSKSLVRNLVFAVIILIIANILIPLNAHTNDKPKRIPCETFTIQIEAQAHFDSDPIKYKNLDGWDDDNKDGERYGAGELACEHLPLK